MRSPVPLPHLRAIQALGTTPLAYSLQQVASDFGNAPAERTVILVTDGKEERGGKPVAAVSELVAKGLKVQVNIVGSALAEEALKREIERVAEFTGGQFFDAKDRDSLRVVVRVAGTQRSRSPRFELVRIKTRPSTSRRKGRRSRHGSSVPPEDVAMRDGLTR